MTTKEMLINKLLELAIDNEKLHVANKILNDKAIKLQKEIDRLMVDPYSINVFHIPTRNTFEKTTDNGQDFQGAP